MEGTGGVVIVKCRATISVRTTSPPPSILLFVRVFTSEKPPGECVSFTRERIFTGESRAVGRSNVFFSKYVFRARFRSG